MTLLIYILLTLYIISDVYKDYETIVVDKQYVNHNKKVMYRSIVFGCLMVLHLFNNKDLINNILLFLSMCFYYWFLFDGLLNKARGLSFFYIGKTSKIDKLLRKSKICEVIITPLKLFLFFICLAFYLY